MERLADTINEAMSLVGDGVCVQFVKVNQGERNKILPVLNFLKKQKFLKLFPCRAMNAKVTLYGCLSMQYYGRKECREFCENRIVQEVKNNRKYVYVRTGFGEFIFPKE